MEVNVAIVQLRQTALSDRSPTRTLNPADYDVLLLHELLPSTSSGMAGLSLDEPTALRSVDHSAVTIRSEGKRAQHLPRLRVPFDHDPSEEALKLVRRLAGPNARNRLWRRAVQVGLWKSEASSISSRQSDVFFSGSRHYGTLYCIPVLEKDKTVFTVTPRRGRFENLSKLLNLCQNSSEAVDPETRHLVIRLEEWLREKQRQKPRFLTNLFLRAAATSRVRLCAHNPAYDPDESRSCHGRVVTKHDASDNRKSCELADEVRRGNDARAKMIFFEKYDVFIMNPLFGAGLCYHAKETAPAYFAKGRPSLSHMHRHSYLSQQVSTSTGGTGNHENASAESAASWTEEYPLHRCAYLGEADTIKQLLSQGHDPNQADSDSWTPLHYAAWYGKLEAMQVLLNYGNCDVNLRNKSGSTALHFAAWYGNVYMVELLMSHPGIIIEAKDKDGKSPRDLCECVPKPEFQAIARLLQASSEEKLAKIQVDMMDGSNTMLSLVSGSDTTAAQLHEQLCNELKLSEACGRLFAVWICSESLELQLKAEHKPLSHMLKWHTKILPKWSDSAEAAKEKPRLVFRRDARATLGDEKQAGLTDAAMTLLYEEARYNYLRGLYPCSDQDMTALASIMMHILHGSYDAKKDKAHLANEKTQRLLLPEHRLRNLNKKEQATLEANIIQERKAMSNKGVKGITALQYQFLSFCWNLCVYGSTFFDALVFMTRPVKGDLHVHVGVNDYGLHLINTQTKLLFQTYPLKGLEWTHKSDNPYLEIRAKQPGQLSSVHVLTVKTRQASHINMLLSKLQSSNNSRSWSRSNLRQS